MRKKLKKLAVSLKIPIAGDGYRQPAIQSGLAGRAQIEVQSKARSIQRDFTFEQQDEVLERSIELAKVFQTERFAVSISGGSTTRHHIARP